jgi:hypothetical protein
VAQTKSQEDFAKFLAFAGVGTVVKLIRVSHRTSSPGGKPAGAEQGRWAASPSHRTSSPAGKPAGVELHRGICGFFRETLALDQFDRSSIGVVDGKLL